MRPIIGNDLWIRARNQKNVAEFLENLPQVDVHHSIGYFQ